VSYPGAERFLEGLQLLCPVEEGSPGWEALEGWHELAALVRRMDADPSWFERRQRKAQAWYGCVRKRAFQGLWDAVARADARDGSAKGL